MTDPTNKRDQRREARRQQLVQRQTVRRRERVRAIRVQRIQRIAIIVGVAIVLALLIWGIVAFASTPHTRAAPALSVLHAASHALALAASSPAQQVGATVLVRPSGPPMDDALAPP